MQGIHIIATGRALPKRIVTNDDMSRMVDTSHEWIVSRTGICQRYLCEEETTTTLALEAAQKAIREAVEEKGIRLQDIGVVVVATVTAEYNFPSTACLLQKELGLSTETMALDISAACSGFIYGLEVCRGLLLAKPQKKYALLIGSEQLSRVVDYTDRSTCILFGDGAGAAIVELDERPYAHKAWADGNKELLFCKGAGYPDSKLRMDGQEVFKFAVKVLRQGLESILTESQLGMDDVDYVICHQANRRIIEHVMKKYPGQEEKFYMNIESYGNTSGASIPIALDEMRERGLLEHGMNVIMIGFGAGLTWAAVRLTV